MPRSRSRNRTRAEGSVSTSRQQKHSGEMADEEAETRRVPVNIEDCQNPAYVQVGGGITKNMGDFNSIRVDVKVTMPCLPTDDKVREVYKELSDTVDELLTEELELAEEKAQN